MKKNTLWLIILGVILIGGIAFLTWKFLPKIQESQLESQGMGPDQNSQEFAYMQVVNYVKTLPEYDNLAYTIVIKPSRLRCAGCYVGILTIDENGSQKYFDVNGTVVTQSDGSNL